MWIRKQLFEQHLHAIVQLNRTIANAQGVTTELRTQKAKDDVTIDWLRNRVNALEKEKSALLMKENIYLPIPEIQQSVPKTLEASFDHLPSFEDVGNEEALRLGIRHNDDGEIVYTK